MMFGEVIKRTGLTRKAVEYYIEQGFIAPQVRENGYRTFSEADVLTLTSISVYRRLGLSVAEIRSILGEEKKNALRGILIRRRIDVRRQKQKSDLLALLAEGAEIDDILPKLKSIDAQESIADRLLQAFPGCFGQYMMLHFSHFLQDPIKTQEQQEAYETILGWLDNLPPLSLPEDLASFLGETTQELGAQRMDDLHAALCAAGEDPQTYFREHEDAIRAYMEMKETAAYKESPAAQLMESIKDFQRQSGYIDIFLPAMETLSPAYAAYRAQLKKADDALMKMLEK